MPRAPNLQDLIEIVRHDTAGDEPLALLATAADTAAALVEATDGLLGYFVDGCRAKGRSWREISTALGVTKQAANRRFGGTTSLDRFTPRARRVVEMAATMARSLNHTYVGTEHVLLSLLTEGHGVGARVLRELGLTPAGVESAIFLVVPRGTTSPSGELPLTPRVATTLTGAVTAALELNHKFVGTEHLLLALTRDPDALAARILTAHQISDAEIRKRVAELVPEGTTAT
jgi:hypothetical protein